MIKFRNSDFPKTKMIHVHLLAKVTYDRSETFVLLICLAF